MPSSRIGEEIVCVVGELMLMDLISLMFLGTSLKQLNLMKSHLHQLIVTSKEVITRGFTLISLSYLNWRKAVPTGRPNSKEKMFR